MSEKLKEKKREPRQHKDAKVEQIEQVDFKMVTFSLAGKEYGIDIMKVEEISKAGKFTFVPNSIPFVRGVYNLRGEIISIIDLRIMFNLPAETKKDGSLENIVILRVENHLIGVIVDSIEKVIGISSASIQPPHPLFGDINVKYIKGVVENNEKLYIILDVDKIFTQETETAADAVQKTEESTSGTKETNKKAADTDELDFNFIVETLATFANFHVTEINKNWVESRYQQWKEERQKAGEDIQLKSKEDAFSFLEPFQSPSTGRLWSEDYLSAVEVCLPSKESGNITVWDCGCGKGYEAYSLAVGLKKKNSETQIKVWANDNDLLSISTAPNLQIPKNKIPEIYDEYLVEGKNGFQFSEEIKDSIMFEYHDILNPNPLPEVDMVVARDLLSFLSPEKQTGLINDFYEKLKPGGVLILGEHETINDERFQIIEESNGHCFRRQGG